MLSYFLINCSRHKWQTTSLPCLWLENNFRFYSTSKSPPAESIPTKCSMTCAVGQSFLLWKYKFVWYRIREHDVYYQQRNWSGVGIDLDEWLSPLYLSWNQFWNGRVRNTVLFNSISKAVPSQMSNKCVGINSVTFTMDPWTHVHLWTKYISRFSVTTNTWVVS